MKANKRNFQKIEKLLMDFFYIKNIVKFKYLAISMVKIGEKMAVSSKNLQVKTTKQNNRTYF